MRILAFTFIGMILCVGCTTRVQYEYFEPSGMGVTISSPDGAPKNVAQRKFAGGELSVWSTVTAHGAVEVYLRMEVAAGHTLSFSDHSAVISSGDEKAASPLVWSQWRIIDGRGSSADVPFDSQLTGPTFRGRPPKIGTQILGRYDCTVTLPEQLSRVREFRMELPAPREEGSPLHLKFVRKVADYRMFVQLQ